MRRAIALAREHGIGAVTVRDSNHFGAAALYAKLATDEGLIGNRDDQRGPEHRLSRRQQADHRADNPIAVGVPLPLPFPFMLDISMSSVSRGQAAARQQEERENPARLGDRPGRSHHRRPRHRLQGIPRQPVGGHKGFGLSLVVDILCGVISGGAFQFGLAGLYSDPDKPSHTGHMMIVVDPEIAMGPRVRWRSV